MYKMVYSNSLDCMVVKGFTVYTVYIDKRGLEAYKLGKGKHYTWNDEDCLYYYDESDEEYYDGIPVNGRRKIILCGLTKRGRQLIILDK